MTYVAQSLISWTGRIVALLWTVVDIFSHKMGQCPFISHPSKKQLCAFSAFRKNATVVKGSCLQVVKTENATV
jgi:hypothetical protein